MCFPFFLLAKATPFSAMLLDSVALPMNMSSLGSAFIIAATAFLDSSKASFASLPCLCRDMVFPYFSLKYGVMALRTRGSTGVVAA